LDDAGLAGLLASVTTGLIKLVAPARVHGKTALGTMIGLSAGFGLLGWGADIWHVVATIRNAAVAMIGSVATGLGVFEAYRRRGDGDEPNPA